MYTFLILHGWNLSADRFLPLQKELVRRGYKVHCADLPGFGMSGFPDHPLYLSDYVDFVSKYVKGNNLDKIILIGHSFGGRISIKLAAGDPKYLRVLILTGVPGINPVSPIKMRFFLLLAKIGNIAFSLPLLSKPRDMARKLLYKAAHASDFYNTNKKMRKTFKNIVRENLIPYLSQIRVPTLLLWGEEDKIIPVSSAQKLQKLIKNSKLEIIDNARHGVPWTHPKEFADEVEKFLNEVM